MDVARLFILRATGRVTVTVLTGIAGPSQSLEVNNRIVFCDRPHSILLVCILLNSF